MNNTFASCGLDCGDNGLVECAGRYEGAVRFDVDAKGPYQDTCLRIRDAAAARTNTLTIATAPTSTALVPYTPQYPAPGGRNGKGGGQGGKGGKGGKGRGPPSN